MSVTGGILAGVGLAGSIGAAAIGSNASQNAASTQSSAAEQAAQLQYQASQNALGFQENQWNTEQADLQPWLQSGNGALSNLDYLLGVQPQAVGGGAATTGTLAPQSFTGSTAAPNTGTGAATNIGSQVGRPTAMVSSSPSGISPIKGSGVVTPPGYGPTQTPTSGAVPFGQSATPVTSGAPVGNPAAGGAPTPGGAAPSAASAIGGGFGSLLTPYSGTFTAPTAEQALNSPGEQAQLQLGDQAVQQSAAANGSLLTGGTLKALDNYGQNLASTNYQNVYNDSYNTYAANYNQYENNQANQFNRLASLAGVGQQTAQQLGTLGQSASNAVGSNLMGTASAMGQDYQNAAAANASGYVGSANAWGGALGSSTNSLQNLLLLQQLGGLGGGSSSQLNIPGLMG